MGRPLHGGRGTTLTGTGGANENAGKSAVFFNTPDLSHFTASLNEATNASYSAR